MSTAVAAPAPNHHNHEAVPFIPNPGMLDPENTTATLRMLDEVGPQLEASGIDPAALAHTRQTADWRFNKAFATYALAAPSIDTTKDEFVERDVMAAEIEADRLQALAPDAGYTRSENMVLGAALREYRKQHGVSNTGRELGPVHSRRIRALGRVLRSTHGRHRAPKAGAQHRAPRTVRIPRTLPT